MTAIRPLLILGMHRSGTSCLAGCLQEAGLYLGEVNTKAGFNKKGNREHRGIMELHEHVLNRHGAAWDNPPNGRIKWDEHDLQSLIALTSTFPTSRNWGTKDPRTLFTLSGWKTVFEPRCIGTFRHPGEVANSLQRRAQAWGKPMERAHALALWQSYNTQMLDIYRAQPFPIVRFDVPKESYLKALQAAGPEIGMDIPENLTFRETELRHERIETDPVPKHLKTLWEALNDLCL